MHEFKQLENENIIYSSEVSYLKRDNNIEEVALVLTNFRLLIFIDISKHFEYKVILEASRGKPLTQKEIIFETMLDDILRIENFDLDFDKYILKSSNYFLLGNKEVAKLISKGN